MVAFLDTCFVARVPEQNKNTRVPKNEIILQFRVQVGWRPLNRGLAK